MSVPKTLALVFLVLFVAPVGVAHFVFPEAFARVVPPPIPALPAVYVSGFFELLGVVGLLIPATRRAAAWGLIALFICVFPANLYMATDGIQPDPSFHVPRWAAWARLPFQGVLIALAAWLTSDERPRGTVPREAP